MGCCPAHDDKTPSLSITDAPGGKILVHCHRGCSQEAVVAELKTRKLWPNGVKANGDKKSNAAKCWDGASVAPIDGTPADKYLRSRGIDPAKLPGGAYPPTLRWGPKATIKIDDDRSHQGCLIAKTKSGVARIALTDDGAPVCEGGEKLKKSLGKMAGGCKLGTAPDPEGRLGIAEGIETGLSAAQLYGMPVTASVGASNMDSVDIPEWIREVTIFADNDEAGRKAATRAAWAVRDRGLQVRVFMPGTAGADFNDVLVGGGEIDDVTVTLMAEEQRRNDAIRALSESDGLGVAEKRQLSAMVTDRLLELGKFYRIEEVEDLYYFHDAERELYLIGSLAFRALLRELFGINAKEPAWAHVEEDLTTHCKRRGKPTRAYVFAHYDKVGCKLYVRRDRRSMFRLDGSEDIEVVDNGTDGILFLESEGDPIEPDFDFTGSPVREHLVDIINVADADAGRRDLYHCSIYGLFFEELQPTKVIVLVTGIRGSGKTSVGKALKRALFGPGAKVELGLSDKEDAFWAMACGKYVVCIDNLDEGKPWLGSAIATVATGGKVQRRKLFETNTLVEYTPRCFLMITSRNPECFTRDDVTDRLLLIEVERREKFKPESVIEDEVDAARRAIWGELLTNLNRIVAELKEGGGVADGEFRMADFARLAMLTGPIIGVDKVEEKLKALEVAKDDFILRDDRLVEALEGWIAANPEHVPIRSGELFKDIVEREKLMQREFYIKSPRTFGTKLRNIVPSLKDRYDVDVTDGGKNTKAYQFKSKEPTDEQPPY